MFDFRSVAARRVILTEKQPLPAMINPVSHWTPHPAADNKWAESDTFGRSLLAP